MMFWHTSAVEFVFGGSRTSLQANWFSTRRNQMSGVERSAWIIIVAYIVLLCSGARAVADDPTALVRGKITVDGKPVAAGRIFFFIDEDQFVGAKVKDGEFKVDRAPVGAHVVTVESVVVPSKYSDKSELRVEVKMGTNVFNFDFKGK
jgi:hypothetical protein